MFNSALSFNQPLNTHTVTRQDGTTYMAWDVSKVTIMSEMFTGVSNFNQPLNNWNVSKVKNMQSMFSSARSFNQDISNWDVSNVTNMRGMFFGATAMLRKLPHLKLRRPVGTPIVDDWKADMYPRDKLFLDFKEPRDEEELKRKWIESQQFTGVLDNPFQNRTIKELVLDYMDNQPRQNLFQ